MAELLLLHPKIGKGFSDGMDFERHALDDRDTGCTQRRDLGGIIGEQSYALDPQPSQDGRTLVVGSLVGTKAESKIRLHRIEPLILKLVGANLIEQSDASALLWLIDDQATPLLFDQLHGAPKLPSTIALDRMKDITGQALRVNADEAGRSCPDVPLDENHVCLTRLNDSKSDHAELTDLGRKPGFGNLLDADGIRSHTIPGRVLLRLSISPHVILHAGTSLSVSILLDAMTANYLT